MGPTLRRPIITGDAFLGRYAKRKQDRIVETTAKAAQIFWIGDEAAEVPCRQEVTPEV